MSREERNADPRARLAAARQDLRQLRGSFATEAAYATCFLRALHRLDEQLRNNDELDSEHRVPFGVFEGMLERLVEIAVSTPSEVLYRGLSEQPASLLGRDRVLVELRGALIEVLSQRITELPSESELYLARAVLFVDGKELELAQQDVQAALRVDGESLEARRAEALIALREHDEVEGLRLLDGVLRRWPADEAALVERARVRLRFFQVREALVDLHQLAETSLSQEARLFVAKQFLFIGDPAQALQVARGLGESLESLLVMGDAHLASGDLELAGAALRRAAAIVGGQAETEPGLLANVWRLLGEVHLRSGDHGDALSCFLHASSLGGATYEVQRGVAKAAWAGLRVSQRAASSKSVPEQWIEASMEARFVDGVPVELRCADLSSTPYLERLPWPSVVEHLQLGFGRRDNREALVHLFRMELPRLKTLEVQAEYFGYPCLRRLIQAPFFSTLEELALRECDLDESCLELLLRTLPPRLRVLRVVTADATPKLPRDTTLADLLRRLHAPHLEVLELSSCGLGPSEAMAIGEANVPALTTLVLTGNSLAGLEVDLFLDSAVAAQLSELRAGDSGCEPALVRGVLARLANLRLQALWVQRDWSLDEVRQIRAQPAAKQLSTLELGVSSIDEATWIRMLDE